MDDLLEKLVLGTLGENEPRLYRLHCEHFCARVRCLDPSFFPGQEKSPDSAHSLAGGAYVSFSKEPEHKGETAFAYVVHRGYRPAKGFLYYWRDSATIRFLRKEGSELLRARMNIQRSIRLHLKQGFAHVGMRRGQILWALPESAHTEIRPVDLEKIGALPPELRGKELIRAILEAAGAPMTRAEIGAVIERRELAREVSMEGAPDGAYEGAVESVLMRTLQRRFEELWQTFDDEERRLLALRGYAEAGGATASFRQIAEKLGRLGAESYRLMERRIFERLRARFDEQEMREIVVLLAHKISELS